MRLNEMGAGIEATNAGHLKAATLVGIPMGIYELLFSRANLQARFAAEA